MDIAHKIGRVRDLARVAGLREALAFEAAWSLRRPEVAIRLPGLPNPLVVRRRHTDISLLISTFVGGEFEPCLPDDPRLIVDAGANVGYAAAFYAARFPGAKVVAIEPDRTNFAQATRNTAGFGNVTVVHGALWHRSASVRIANPGAKSWSFECREGDGGSDDVRGYTVEEILELAGADEIDLFKIDIEGAERDLFGPGCERWLGRVRMLAIETHGDEARAAVERACAGAFRMDEVDAQLFFRRVAEPAADPA